MSRLKTRLAALEAQHAAQLDGKMWPAWLEFHDVVSGATVERRRLGLVKADGPVLVQLPCKLLLEGDDDHQDDHGDQSQAAL